ncbi:MAG: ATP-dependent DNA helicase RecG [Bacteroidales bacterium]|nr:ATP-dependent DNA helicase RecG [Bacteroidales bacterium]
MMDLSQELTYLKGVGPSRADILAKELQITCQEDLLYYFPYKYIDRSRIFKISELTAGMPYIQICGRIVAFQQVGEGRAKRLTAKFSDDTGSVELVWFKGGKYIEQRYKVDEPYLVFGKPAQYGNQISIAHPDLDVANERNLKILTGGLQAYYNTTEKMKNSYLNSRALQKIMVSLFQSINSPLPETLPDWLIGRLHLKPLNEALRQVHFPTDAVALRDARYRLKLEELLFLQLQILRFANERNRKLRGYPFRIIGENFNNFYRHRLPFSLTGAQKRVLKEIRANVAGEVQMNRLIQGDVGSGKTLVALMSMLMAVDNGYQACLMAPTEILANQHYDNIRRLLGDLPVRVALLTGSTKKKDRVPMHEDLRNGQLHLLIGTHALIEDEVQFKCLGLVVIDEQHRFGVVQRSRLWTKSERAPHVLVMTATPIPRTLAMTLYGDLDVSVIDELPPGRKPIQTIHRYDNQLADLYRFMHRSLQEGRQIYVVYPLIEESERSDYKNLLDGYEHIRSVFSEVEVGMVHGKMKPAEKEEQMQRFVRGETRILVATTVIEVGVDVPNASIIVIQNAERFGLSQLHQLRGRVGRGADQSYCVLLTSYKLSQDGRKRIDIMTSSNDGFEISEADLKMRGPGDIEGVQQSGMPFDLKIADLARDGQLIEYARRLAQEILKEDPDLETPGNVLLKNGLKKRYGKRINWGVIS